MGKSNQEIQCFFALMKRMCLSSVTIKKEHGEKDANGKQKYSIGSFVAESITDPREMLDVLRSCEIYFDFIEYAEENEGRYPSNLQKIYRHIFVFDEFFEHISQDYDLKTIYKLNPGSSIEIDFLEGVVSCDNTK